jgi:hypothetical protein
VGLLHQGFVTDARAELLEALRLDASNEIARYHVGFAEDFGGFTQSHFLRVGTWWWRRTGRERLAVVVTFALGAIVWPGFVITALVLATIETSSSLRRRLRAKRGPQDPVTQKLDRMLNVSYTVALFGPILVMVLTGHQEWVMGAGLGVLLSLVIAVAHPTGPRHWIAFSLAVVLGILGVLTRPLALSPLVVNLLGLASVLLYLPTQFGSAGKGQPGAED